MGFLKKNDLHMIVGLLLAGLILLLLPASNGLTPTGVRTIAAAVLIIYWWIFISIDWVSLLAIALFAMAGAASVAELCGASFGNWVVPFVIVICILNYALERVGFIQRMVTWFISRNIIQGRAWVFFTLFAVANYILNMFLNIVSIVLIMLPVCKSICEELDYKPGDKFPQCLYLITMWVSLLGFSATPIGHSIPLMVMGLMEGTFGVAITVTQWMLVGIPSTLLLLVLTLLVCRFIINPDTSRFSGYDVAAKRQSLRKMEKKEKLVVTIFAVMIFFLFAPDLFKGIFPAFSSLLSGWGTLTISTIAMCAMLVLRVDGEPLINFTDASRHISWTSVFLAVGTFALSSAFTAESTGIVPWLTSLCGPFIRSLDSWFMFALIASGLVIVLTNFFSCPVVANVVYVVLIPLACNMDASVVNPLAVAMIIGIACNFGVMTPPASFSSTILLGTEYLSVSAGFKYGLINMILSILVSIFVIYPLAAIVF